MSNYLTNKQHLGNKVSNNPNKKMLQQNNLQKLQNSSVIHLSEKNNLNILNNNKGKSNKPQLVSINKAISNKANKRKHYNNFEDIMKTKKIENEISNVEKKIEKNFKKDDKNFDFERESDIGASLANIKSDENPNQVININIFTNLTLSDSSKSKSFSSKRECDTQKEDSFIQNISFNDHINFNEGPTENTENTDTNKNDKILTEDYLNPQKKNLKKLEKTELINKEKNQKTQQKKPVQLGKKKIIIIIISSILLCILVIVSILFFVLKK